MSDPLSNAPVEGMRDGGSNLGGTQQLPDVPEDPFVTTPSSHSNHPYRFSNFGAHLFALNPSTSPSQAKRALEVHLAETERRIQDASKLGTTLLQQQKELTERLREVEKEQGEGEIGPELRQKLIDLEKEYNDVGRESVRALLGPKSRVSSAESPFAVDGRNPASPATFSSQATSSPSKLNVPSRKQRNQPTSRVHDIEFATEISTSLLSQVRHLQALLAERDESIKAIDLDKSRLELEAEGFAQRIRALDESEQRYKDENWALETQTHDLIAQVKAAADREQKLTQSLSALSGDKNIVQRELDELKQASGKLNDDYAASQKHYELDLSGIRRNLTMCESERAALQRKIEDLNSQNEELARAVAGRFRQEDTGLQEDLDAEVPDPLAEHATPENSPPPSPTKATPRHSMLESETLKSSLHHAHRMIQNLKGNIHREKTEKLELKRMLQEARDELELRRSDSGLVGVPSSASKRRKANSERELFKKPAKPALLGAGRNSKSEVILDEAGWEDHSGEERPGHTVQPMPASVEGGSWMTTESSDAFETANDETSDAFETANEREGTLTESEAFQTVEESLGTESSDELTETESGFTKGSNLRAKRPQIISMTKPRPRDSCESTASTSADDDDDDEHDIRTPVQPQQQRLRLKINRGALYRRSRVSSEISMFNSNFSSPKDSPSSFISNGSRAALGGQSLFTELGDLGVVDTDEEEEEEEDMLEGTPSKKFMLSQASSPGSRPITARKGQTTSGNYTPPIRNVETRDYGIMTDPWDPTPPPATSISTIPMVVAAVAGTSALDNGTDREPSTTPKVDTLDASSQWSEASIPAAEKLDVGTQSDAPLLPQTSDMAVQHDPRMEAKIPSLPAPIFGSQSTQTDGEEPSEELTSIDAPSAALPAATSTVALEISSIQSLHTEPVQEPATELDVAPFALSGIQSLHTEPERVKETEEPVAKSSPVSDPNSLLLDFSSIHAEEVEPVSPVLHPPPRDSRRLSSIVAAPLPFGSVSNQAEKDVPNPWDTNAISELSSDYPSFLGSAPDRNKTRKAPPPDIVEDESSYEPPQAVRGATDDSKHPFKDISNNVGPRDLQNKNSAVDAKRMVPEMVDQGAQTTVSWESFENMLKKEKGKRLGLTTEDTQVMPSPRDGGAQIVPPLLKSRQSQDSISSIGGAKAGAVESGINRPDDGIPLKPAKRPGSSGSVRSSSSAHPPLPPDHKQAIAAAAQRISSEGATGLMGPPLAPASALNRNLHLRPRTPTAAVQYSPGSRSGTTPRPRFPTAGSRSEVSSPVPTRRSSVSSFASELNQRFNIGTDGMPVTQHIESGTDPRMIQAITQTMIGEYLWKYTRKAGRGEMSANRHRRFFWVHPYTRTLYWSERDPQMAGRTELKAKSVAIEAVRVITDDNPMPPGLHRKSLVIITPGRAVQFTATTGQRHETWFNALSYLLLRTGAEHGVNGTEDVITMEDVDEFNPSYEQSRRAAAASLSSYNSHTRMTSPQRNTSSMSQRRSGAASAASYHQQPAQSQGSMSRLSNMFRPTSSMRGSFSSRRSRYSEKSASLYDASEVHNSAEDLREMIELQDREADKLENVRACCDGKHDVGSLAKTGRHSSQASRYSHHTHNHHHATEQTVP
ncbi:hypothetical protein FGG08_005783 [Glutinoglossum americanum]|uniref:PH domain-containing protein n=1 Tax=Glutinoglossum americanum TaxID=1670608 RepID=A0A9P8L1I9_9PEZI|nr:hypothetical protein FGG08_005783 [Glutinoglossum americanum]